MGGLNARLKFVFCTTFVLIFAVAAGWAWFHWLGTGNGQPTSDAVMTEAPGGNMILTYGKKTENGVQLLPIVYSVSDSRMIKVPADRLVGQDGDSIVYHHSFANNDRWAVFTTIDTKLFTEDSPVLNSIPHQIYLADLRNADSAEDVLSSLQAAQKFTNSDSVKIFPSVSGSGDVLFMSHALEQSDTAFLDSVAEDWEIYLVRPNGSEQMIAKGTQPKWVDEDRFLFLKNDGVYSYSISNNTESPLFRTSLRVDAQNRLDVNKDGTDMAWTLPNMREVRLFNIVENNDGELELASRTSLEEPAGSVVFSPDGRWLALQTSGHDTANTEEKLNVITIYDLDNMTKLSESFAFGGAAQNATHITDWIR